jgi:hypothetical protein
MSAQTILNLDALMVADRQSHAVESIASTAFITAATTSMRN